MCALRECTSAEGAWDSEMTYSLNAVRSACSGPITGVAQTWAGMLLGDRLRLHGHPRLPKCIHALAPMLRSPGRGCTR